MKKYAPILLVLLLAGNVRAQQYEKNILGVRAGLNVAWMTASSDDASGSTNGRAGVRISVSDQILLSRRLPLYIETGVDFSSRGGRFKIEGYDYGPSSATTEPAYQNVSLRPMYLQIPLLISYRFSIRSRFTVRPFLGVCYGVGMGGRIKVGKSTTALFGDSRPLTRSDFGVRMGVGFGWKRICFGLSGDMGCLNILKREASFAGGYFRNTGSGARLTNNSISVQVGYDF